MNRFGTFLGLAHAAMTAEGDNSVLMQKVAKERLGEIAKTGFEILKDMNAGKVADGQRRACVKDFKLNIFW